MNCHTRRSVLLSKELFDLMGDFTEYPCLSTHTGLSLRTKGGLIMYRITYVEGTHES